jgi:3',5'-nucleoside bisphosphate phosphatase
MSNRADLHTHTTASDGKCRPADNVKLAKAAGLAAVAITDHDTVAGVAEALEAGRQEGVIVVPGVEISTSANGKDIHVLGYGFSPENPQLLRRLEAHRNGRNERNERILVRLAELGLPVTMSEVEAVAGKRSDRDGSVGRPHIAQAMVDKGYATDIRDAFDRFLAEGKAAYVVRQSLSPQEAIAWLQEAGGKAIIAHPGLYRDDDLVLSLLQAGADGLEAYHSDHGQEEETRYAGLAASLGKLATGGSDFHGMTDGEAFHGPIGHRTVDVAVVKRLLNEE